MSLKHFQRAMVDLAASPALCARVREDADAALAPYALTEVERRRLQSAAAQRGMIVNGMLYRSNRLAPLNSQLPNTFLLLGPALRATAEAFWAVYPSLERDAPTEVRRFAAFVQARAADGLLEEPLIPEVLAWEVDVFERALLAPRRVLAEVADDAARARADGPLRLHPLVALSAFTVEPAALLTALFARRRPPYDDVPHADGSIHYLLSDLRGEQRAFFPIPSEMADALRAVRDGGWVDRGDAEGLIERGWVVAE
jgi:hypothetical protein